MSAPSESDPLGYDVWVLDDISSDGREASGAELVANALIHRLTTRKLLLIDAPGGEVDFGIDVRTWVGEALTPTRAQAKAPLVEITCQRGPGISTIRATVALAGPTLGEYDLTISLSGTLADGAPLALTLGVSSVTVDLLAKGR